MLIKVEAIFDMRPYFIEQRLKLRNPIYSETAAAIWDVRLKLTKTFLSRWASENDYGWIIYMGKLDFVDQVKAAFGL
jgi:S-adenosylmethionine synthetase